MARLMRTSRVRRHASAGFSLTETLVVAGISAAMMAALIPMVSATVATSRSLTCKNNLNRLASALQAYHDLHGNFPPSFEYPPSLATSPTYVSNVASDYPNWVIRILPFLNEQALFDSIDFSKKMSAFTASTYPNDNPNRNVTATDLQIMWCPADTGHDVRYRRQVGFKTGTGAVFQEWARGNYAANACLSFPITYGAFSPHSTSSCGSANEPEWMGQYGLPLRGVMGGNVSVPRPGIIDGVGNTILLSEVNVGLLNVDFRGSWAMGTPGGSSLWVHVYGPNENYDTNGSSCNSTTGSGMARFYYLLSGSTSVSAGGQIAFNKNMLCGVNDGWMSGGNPKSRHDGGLFVAMADGSVKFIKNEVDVAQHNAYWTGDLQPPYNRLGVWERLNMSADGMVVETDTETVIPFVLGDMNGDGYVNNLDIGPFDLALTKPAKYQEQFPALTDYRRRGDCNLDGEFNNLDIQPFEELLAGNR